MKVDRAVFRNLHLATAMTLVGLLFSPPKGCVLRMQRLPSPLNFQELARIPSLSLSAIRTGSLSTAVRNAKGKWERHGNDRSGDEGEGFCAINPRRQRDLWLSPVDRSFKHGLWRKPGGKVMQTYLSSYRLLILSTLVALSAALPAQETRRSEPSGRE